MIHCFYHSSDLDGHCSGAIVKHKFPEAQMHSINYDQQFPWDKVNTEEDIIIMVDFSLQPFLEMAKLYTEFDDRLIWIDHHISAIEEAKNGKMVKAMKLSMTKLREFEWLDSLVVN